MDSYQELSKERASGSSKLKFIDSLKKSLKVVKINKNSNYLITRMPKDIIVTWKHLWNHWKTNKTLVKPIKTNTHVIKTCVFSSFCFFVFFWFDILENLCFHFCCCFLSFRRNKTSTSAAPTPAPGGLNLGAKPKKQNKLWKPSFFAIRT